MKNNAYYITDEVERQFVKKVELYMEQSSEQYRPFLTDFYNASWLQEMMKCYFSHYNQDMYTLFGGYQDAERQVMCICPYHVTEEVYGICALKIKVRTGIGKPLSHRDYLGAVLGLGIDRRQIGDIIIKPFGAYIIVQKNMTDYIKGNLLTIGRYHKIEIEEIPFQELLIEKPKTKEIVATVSSLRGDAVAAHCFGLSRSECAKLIQGQKLKCNGVIVATNSPIKEGDLLVLKGYGKAKLSAINGQTKKERLRITIEKYI